MKMLSRMTQVSMKRDATSMAMQVTGALTIAKKIRRVLSQNGVKRRETCLEQARRLGVCQRRTKIRVSRCKSLCATIW